MRVFGYRTMLALGTLVTLSCGACATSSRQVAKGSPTASGATVLATHAKMEGFNLHGYALAGAEYWPYVGSADIDYPKDVLWGFYPVKGVLSEGETSPNAETANPMAVQCAERAYDALRAWITTNPDKLRAIVTLGDTQGYAPRFFLWTNDYTRAASPYPPGVREARLWYWKRKMPEAGRPPGYWKWESTLTQKGECKVPQSEPIESYLTETLATVRAAVR